MLLEPGKTVAEDTYYKLAVWDGRSLCWRDGKRGYATEAAARAAATKPNRYRVSQVTPAGDVDGEPFDVSGTTEPKPARPAKRGLSDRPLGGQWL
jgi:hypothetical protein